MKDLQPKTMTVKQVAEAYGVSPKTIQRRVKELFPDKMVEKEETLLTEYEVTAVTVRMKQNRNLSKNLSSATLLPQTEMEETLVVAQAMQILQNRISSYKSENEQLKIELDESKQYHSVKKVKNLGYLPEISARKMWNPLKQWSIENDYKIISIFDANYGEVKTYHADAWKAVYGVEL